MAVHIVLVKLPVAILTHQQFCVKYYYSQSSFRTPPVPSVFEDNPVYRRRLSITRPVKFAADPSRCSLPQVAKPEPPPTEAPAAPDAPASWEDAADAYFVFFFDRPNFGGLVLGGGGGRPDYLHGCIEADFCK